MTTNPRALDVACAVLGTADARNCATNIRERGKEALDKLEKLKAELGGLITKVQGTGLLFSCELAPQFKCYGVGSTEEWLRERGIGVIHGGANSLRFTPHFAMTATKSTWWSAWSAARCAKARGPRPKPPEQPTQHNCARPDPIN